MYYKQIIIFADSVKHHNHCVAGKCASTGIWIRPVADVHGRELTNEQIKYRNKYGVFPIKPLQKINIEFDRHAPLVHQPENHIITDSLWTQNYKIEQENIVEYLDHPDDIWGEGNRVLYADDMQISQSLYLVRVTRVNLYTPQINKRRISFTYNDIDYDLAATSRNFDDLHTTGNFEECILCISLGEPFEGFCYKLVAGIFVR